jgi:hypothetical protein
MGIVTQVTDSPATYERNQEYLNWRRVQQLRNQYDDDDLLAFLENAVARDEAFAEEFDAGSPDAVAIVAQATDTDRSVEAVWRSVSAWKTTRRRISLLERALQTDTDGAAGQRTVARATGGTTSVVHRLTSPV